MSDMYRRREVLKLGSVAGLSTATGSAAEAKPIRIGLVGVGGRGLPMPHKVELDKYEQTCTQ